MRSVFSYSFLLLSLAPISGAKELPKALLIGDSISIGYTPHVIAALKGKVDVKHHKVLPSIRVPALKCWIVGLGKRIGMSYISTGVYGTCYRHPESKNQGRRDKVRGALTMSLEAYEKNLEQLVVRLKKD